MVHAAIVTVPAGIGAVFIIKELASGEEITIRTPQVYQLDDLCVASWISPEFVKG
jgi:hypothetical protein